VDLFDVQSNKEISLEEVMDGLRYVMEYRIKGGRYPSLDYDIMKRLADGLLMNMGNSTKKGHFGQGSTLTEEADVAFQLFGEFILEGNNLILLNKSHANYLWSLSLFAILLTIYVFFVFAFHNVPLPKTNSSGVPTGRGRKVGIGSSSCSETGRSLWIWINCTGTTGGCCVDSPLDH